MSRWSSADPRSAPPVICNRLRTSDQTRRQVGRKGEADRQQQDHGAINGRCGGYLVLGRLATERALVHRAEITPASFSVRAN